MTSERILSMRGLTLTFSILGSLICFPQPTPWAGTNLITNEDFESGQIASWEGHTDAYVSLSGAHSGTNGVGLPFPQYLSQQVSVQPDNTSVYAGWFEWTALSGNNWAYGTFRVTNAGFGSINDLHASYEKDTWRKLAITFKAQTDIAELHCGIYGPQDAAKVHCDAFERFEKTGNPPPVINPSSKSISGGTAVPVQFFATGRKFRRFGYQSFRRFCDQIERPCGLGFTSSPPGELATSAIVSGSLSS